MTENIGKYDKLIAETESPMMKRIYEKAKTLSAVLPVELTQQCWDEAWEDYIEDIRSGVTGITRGNVTIFCDPEKTGEAFTRFDEFSRKKCV